MLTSAQQDAVLAAVPELKYRTAYTVCRYTAARISEVLALRWRHVKQSAIVFERSITKGKRNVLKVLTTC